MDTLITMGLLLPGIQANPISNSIIAIFFMTKLALACLHDYEAQRKASIVREDLTFDPVKLGITGADFLEDRLTKNKNEQVG